MTTANGRTADHPIHPQFLDRWSPRAFDGAPMPRADLVTMLEAARWAPSAFNSQPWRFVYGLRDTPAWEKLFPLLIEFNQSWVASASALVFVFSRSAYRTSKGEEVVSHSHSFDAGCAWGAFALQALAMGYHTHGMTGFDTGRALTTVGAPAGLRAEAAIAVGRLGDKSALPEHLQARARPSPSSPSKVRFRTRRPREGVLVRAAPDARTTGRGARAAPPLLHPGGYDAGR